MAMARAISLIEVVASLLLIATTATALLVAHGRSLQQLKATVHQETAAALAGELMASWKIDPPGPGSTLSGGFQSRPSWRWTRGAQPYAAAVHLQLLEVTLALYRTDDQGNTRALRTYSWLERSDES